MPLPRAYSSIESAAPAGRPVHLAIGIFDGVHLGHQTVIETAVHSARQSGGVPAVLTFRPHPSRLFRPDRPTLLLGNAETQDALFGRLGVEAVVTHAFTREFAALPAEQFLAWLVARLPRLAGVYVGQNWRFGAGRKGDVALLVELGRRHGVSVYSASPVQLNAEPVTSTRIRGLLEAGDVAAANALLGYAYFSPGTVIPGRKLARQLGYPTLNLAWDPELRPRFGVYRVTVDGQPGVANYGVRPTVEAAGAPWLETYLLGSCPYTTGDHLSVEWRQFIRPEQKFGSIDELKTQIARDVQAAR
jgi:riboflavin kinase/FMN adenylyltransferase